MGARASVGQTSFALAVLLGVPSVMMFDWLFWWAGRRWATACSSGCSAATTPRAKRRLARLHTVERRFGPLAVVLAPVLPIPSPLIYAAVGDGGMRLATSPVLDVAGTLLWTGLLATLGYELGQAPSTSPKPSRTTRCGPRSPSSPSSSPFRPCALARLTPRRLTPPPPSPLPIYTRGGLAQAPGRAA